MALVAALLGWMFDGFEIGMFPLVGRPALAELLAGGGGAGFLIGAATGGVVFGWLGDRIGRVRAMSASILTYALFTGACGLATEAWHIAVLRFIASLGMGGEWSLGVALVNEVWPARSRAWIAGLIGAASNVGMGLVPVVSIALVSLVATVRGGLSGVLPAAWVDSLLANQAWRFLMIAGALPALLVFFIRAFVPESRQWEEERSSGRTSHWAVRDLLATVGGAAGAAAVILAWSPAVGSWTVRALVTPLGILAAFAGFVHPVRKYLDRSLAAGSIAPEEAAVARRRLVLGALLAGVPLLGTWGALQWAPSWAIQMTSQPGAARVFAKEYTQLAISAGAIVGTIVAALAAGRFGRRVTYAVLCVASTLALVWLYQANAAFNGRFLLAVGVAGGVTAAFYGWFPLYLPELFPTSIRATSQGFAYNFGRVLAAVGTLQTAQLMGLFGGSFPAAGTVLSGIYLLGLAVIWFGPETSGLSDPESPTVGKRPARGRKAAGAAATVVALVAACCSGPACRAGEPAAAPPTAGWQTLSVPGEWRRATAEAVAAGDGIAWYRAWVKPDDSFFTPHERNLFEESVGLNFDDLPGAHTVWVNGVKLGDGEGVKLHRHKVPVGTLKKGEWNEIAIRVQVPPEQLRSSAVRGGFLGDAPFLMNYFKECVLEGEWQFRPGDAGGPGPALAERPAAAAFDSFRESSQVLGRAEQVHGPSLPPADSAARLHPAEAFAVDLLLHEPLVAQPFHASFDERGRMWITQSRQYPYPAGLKMLSRDKYYRSHYDRVPPAPPHHDRGADIVSIHESSRRDGVYDRHTVFLDGLNMANAALRGRGGVWVMHTPYLLFYPDADGDDVPDGPPEVRLSGFNFEDSHAISNGLVWGPDGWLYGAQGSTSSCTVRRPGLDADSAPGVAFTGCMVWRYHPESRAFEIFAEGGGNNFGLEFDAAGRLFTGHNGGSTRGFHFAQGGFYQKQGVDPGKYGPPRNPYAFGEFEAMFSTDTIVRFTHFGAFGNGTAMPADARGRLFALDPLHNLVTNTRLVPRGASFETVDGEPALRSDDVSFRPVFVTAAPDGSLCLCDMYEYYIAHGQHYQNQIDPTTGRIYRVRGRTATLETDTDLSTKTPSELVALLSHPNVWHRRTAVRLLGERKDPSVTADLRRLVGSTDAVAALHAVWALHQSAGLDEEAALSALASPHPAVRSWAVRLLCDEWGVHRNLGVGNHAAASGRSPDGLLPPRLHAAVLDLARTDGDVEVLCQIAASARRLDPPQAFPLAIAVLGREQAAADAWIPQMGWWVFEANIPAADEAI
ncbi:MAG: MFS transporter, partial [Planctomycetia bacterium]|nr:MFS transporter [Planctomycetia bacterium]